MRHQPPRIRAPFGLPPHQHVQLRDLPHPVRRPFAATRSRRRAACSIIGSSRNCCQPGLRPQLPCPSAIPGSAPEPATGSSPGSASASGDAGPSATAAHRALLPLGSQIRGNRSSSISFRISSASRRSVFCLRGSAARIRAASPTHSSCPHSLSSRRNHWQGAPASIPTRTGLGLRTVKLRRLDRMQQLLLLKSLLSGCQRSQSAESRNGNRSL